jgi:hypothetical protein
MDDAAVPGGCPEWQIMAGRDPWPPAPLIAGSRVRPVGKLDTCRAALGPGCRQSTGVERQLTVTFLSPGAPSLDDRRAPARGHRGAPGA